MNNYIRIKKSNTYTININYKTIKLNENDIISIIGGDVYFKKQKISKESDDSIFGVIYDDVIALIDINEMLEEEYVEVYNQTEFRNIRLNELLNENIY